MNNFDVCSYGIGLETNIYYDTYGDLYRENIACLTTDNRHNNFTHYYTNWGGLKTPEYIGELVSIKGLQDGEIPDVLTLEHVMGVVEDCGCNYWSDTEEILENWQEHRNDILELFNNIPIRHLDDVLECTSVEFKDNVAMYETHGYSQGDYARFIINYNALNEHWGTDIKVDSRGNGISDEDCEAVVSLLDDIEHYFWDCPIRGSITLHYNGEPEDTFVDEFLSDEWEWDKDEFITKVMEYARIRLKDVSDDIMDKLKCDLYTLIPDEPKYL